MNDVSENSFARDRGTLSDLNTGRAGANARLTAAQATGDTASLAAALAQLAELDEAIATLLATVALRNADTARQRRTAA
jgi:predicted short-subunit dehydrogenase-like oxidoreductase (DUF2520 family)